MIRASGKWGAAVLLATLSACASGERRANPQFSSMSEPLEFSADRSGQVDLVGLMDPEGRAPRLGGRCAAPAPGRGGGGRSDEARRAEAVRAFECAASAFKTYHLGADQFAAALRADPEGVTRGAAGSLRLAVRRNDIQDRIVLRSNILCEDFKRRLNVGLRIENETGFGNWVRNSQTRLVGGVGALLLNSDAVWALTNATRISGLPTYVEDTGKIEKATLRVAAEGIDQRRAAMLQTLDLRRAKAPGRGGLALADGERRGVTPITAYSLERAITDALAYHQACSVANGLEYVEEVMARNVPVPVAVEFPALDDAVGHDGKPEASTAADTEF